MFHTFLYQGKDQHDMRTQDDVQGGTCRFFI